MLQLNSATLPTNSGSGVALLKPEVSTAAEKPKEPGREKKKNKIAPSGNKNAIFLGSLTPSPGSYRDALRVLEKGTLTFDPEGLVIAFYQEMVERNTQTGLLEVKNEYQPTETTVYPDSSIYGEIEPNLTLHAEILTAHYQILDNEQRWVIEQHLIEGIAYTSLSAIAGRHISYLPKKLIEGIGMIVRYVYRDYNASTYQPICTILNSGS